MPQANPHSLDLTAHFLIAMPSMEDEAFAKSVVYLCEHSERGALGIVINKPIDITLPKLFAKVDLPLPRADLQQAPVFGGGPLHVERGFVLHEKQAVQKIGDAKSESAHANPQNQTSVQDDEAVRPPQSLEERLLEAIREELSDSTELLAASDAEVAAEVPEVLEIPEMPFYASTLSVSDGLELTTSKDILDALASGAGPRRVLVSLGAAGWSKGQLESELAENAWLTVKANREVIFDTPVAERYSKALELLGLQEWMLAPVGGRA